MKKIRATLSMLVATVLVLTMMSGCNGNSGSSPSDAAGMVNISFLNSKGEIATSLSNAVKAYESTHKNVHITIDSVSASATEDQIMMAKYASGNPETMSMVGYTSLVNYASKSMDLSDQSWAKNIKSNILDAVKYNGKLLCFPFTVEGCGLIYNKTTIEKATKSTFDPTSIKTISDLSALYEKIQNGGVTPVEISSDNWSLAAHFLSTTFAVNGGDSYVNKLRTGSEDISKNADFQSLLKLFNLNKTYNIYKASPMSSNYSTTDPTNIADGKVAFWFNGQWAWPNIKAVLPSDHANDEFGFMPLPFDSRTNDAVVEGPTKLIIIDNTKSTKAQQEAANDFLNWLVNDPDGQKYFVTEMGIIPAFSNISIKPDDPLSKSLAQYSTANKTLPFVILPDNFNTEVGGSMQKYLSSNMSDADLASSITNYFKSK